MAKKKNQHGGVRAHSGRKPILDGPVKILITLERTQRSKLARYIAITKVSGFAAAIRQIIDDFLPGEDSGSWTNQEKEQ